MGLRESERKKLNVFEIRCLYLKSVDLSGRAVVYRINEGQKVLGAVNRVFKSWNVGLNVNKCVYERVIMPTVLYGTETWGLRESERKKLNVFEIRCLYLKSVDLSGRADKSVLF